MQSLRSNANPASLVTALLLLPWMALLLGVPAILGWFAPEGFFALIRNTYNFVTIIFPATAVACLLAIRLVPGRNPRPAGIRILAGFALLAAVVPVGLRIYMTHIEPRMLRVRRVDIVTDKVSAPVSILHISDIQAAEIGSHERRVFRVMKELKPDLLLFTGDLYQGRSVADGMAIVRMMEELAPSLGKYGTDGDVDPWLQGPAGNQGFKDLSPGFAAITGTAASIRLCGLSTEFARSDPRGIVSNWLARAGSNDFTIVMGHAPDYMPNIQNLNIDLCLAGHTHGGQVRIPGFGPIFTLSSIPRKYARGFHKMGNTLINVSAGIGCEHSSDVPQMRFNCPPEMTLIRLLPDQ